MENINNQFLIFLDNIFNTNGSLSSNLDRYFNFFKNSVYIPYNYDKTLKEYPYYPTDYKPITSLSIPSKYSFNTKKIFDSLNMINDDYLKKENFIPDLISTVNKTNKIPAKIENLLFSFLTQKFIINDNYLDNSLINLTTTNISENQQNMFLLLGSNKDYDNSYSNINLMQIITLNIILYYMQKSYFPIQEKLFNYFVTNPNKITKVNTITDFNQFISNEDTKPLTKFILKNNFSIVNPSNSIIESTNDFISDEQIDFFKTTFSNYLNTYTDDLLKTFSQTILPDVDSFISNKIFNTFINNDCNDYLDINNITNTHFNHIFSQNQIDLLMNSINKYDLINYLTPIYSYSYFPIKFINIIPYYTEQYVYNKLLNITQYNLLVDKNLSDNLIIKVLENINISNIKTFLENQNINDIIIDNNISFTYSQLLYKKIITSFINSDIFNNFIIQLLTNINKFLYSEKVIYYGVNWFINIELLKSYFKIFLLSNSIKEEGGKYVNKLCPSLQDELSDFFENENIDFKGTETYITNFLTSFKYNKKFLNDVYYLTKNVYIGYLHKQLYQRVLSEYMN